MQMLSAQTCYRCLQLADFIEEIALSANAYLLMRQALRAIEIAAYDPVRFRNPIRSGGLSAGWRQRSAGLHFQLSVEESHEIEQGM